jgi:probable HAF family extracellular repeat protein
MVALPRRISMSLQHILNALVGPTTRPGPRLRSRPFVEALEDRCVPSYSIFDMGNFIPVHVNDGGVVIGHTQTSGNMNDHAALWTSAGGFQDLGTLGGARSYANGINAAGVVVGTATDASGNFHGFLIQPLDTNQDGIPDLWYQDNNQDGINDLMSDFATLGIPLSSASAINDSGQILSGLRLWDSVNGLQTVYNPPGASYTANGLNNAAQAVGYQSGPFGYSAPFFYSGGQATRIGYLPGDSASQEHDLNDAGQVVGTSGTTYPTGNYSYFNAHEAFMWANGQRTGLGFLPGLNVSQGYGINSFGQVVGTAYLYTGTFPYPPQTNGEAFVWDKGTMTDLNSLIDPSLGWALAVANDIGDQGQIVGTGTLNGQAHAFLLMPDAAPAGIRVRPTPGLTTTEAGGTVQFEVKLNTQPTADVTIPIASSDTTEGVVSTSSLTFTPDNWNTYQTVTVTGVDDPVYDGNIPYKVTTGPAVSADPAYNSLSGADLSLANLDNDPPTVLTINSVTVTEGNSGTVAAVFTVTRSGPNNMTTTVDYSTSTNIIGVAALATAGSDFTPVSGTLTFAPGETTHTITVWVIGDTALEPDETFGVTLSNPVNGIISGGLGLGTILNDDVLPTLSINDVTQVEGNSGTTYFVFTVSLSSAFNQPVSVHYSTSDGTATSSGKSKDYQAASGTLTFAAGETTKTIRIAVYGDQKKEANETFFVNLSGAVNASILDGQGLGTILNDD